MSSSCSSVRLAVGTMAFGLVALAVACGGAEAVDVLGAPTQAGTSSGASSGTSGVGTSSGTSGTGSTTSSGGTTTSSSSSSGDTCPSCVNPPAGCYYPNKCDCNYLCPDAGGSFKCQWTKDGVGGCPEGSYCDAPDCAQGVCVKRGANEGPNKDAQCGCNGVTYWNTSIARKAGMAIRNGGACKPDAPGTALCGGFGGANCPGSSCNMQVAKKQECNIADQGGECWALPTQCPAVAVGGRSRACGLAPTCSDECNAIKKGGTWYDDSSCPQ